MTLGEEKGVGAWSMTLYVKPFVRWIWLGAVFMAIGGTLAAETNATAGPDKSGREIGQGV